MADLPSSESGPRIPRRRLQFSVKSWFLLSFLLSAGLAPLAGLLRGQQDQEASWRLVLLGLLATPLAVGILLGLFFRRDFWGRDL